MGAAHNLEHLAWCSDASSLVPCLQLAGSLVHRLWGPGVCWHETVEFGGAENEW